jgi:SNF2 family DNA or RNA helicase
MAQRFKLNTDKLALATKASPVSFNGVLYPFQESAVDWMIKGQFGILAFDMGLGKTVTTISYYTKISANVRTALIILPLALIDQWKQSLINFTDLIESQILVYHGKKLIDTYKYNPTHRIILTNAESVLDNPYLSLMTQQYVDLIVIDEAHTFRNSCTKKYVQVNQMAALTKHKWLLTGTPIHNSLSDFNDIAILVNGKPILSEDKVEWKSKHYLRKLKYEVDHQLPQKHIHLHSLNLLPTHSNIYHELYSETREYILADGTPQQTKFACVLAKITRLLQACNHPDSSLSDEERKTLNYKSVQSIKMQKIAEIIAAIPVDEKIVVFSKWNSTIDHIKKHVENTIPNARIYIYNGSLTMSQKNAVLNGFKTDLRSSVVLIANILAGGCGLNLTEANHLILVEPAWTHATEQQAIDRVHRIGQTKQCHIHPLVTSDTIEQWIHTLKEEKHILSDQFDVSQEYNVNKSLLQDLLQKFLHYNPAPLNRLLDAAADDGIDV